MNLTVNRFGGVLIGSPRGNIAVNGGGTLEEMEKAYLHKDIPLIGLVLTSEHINRSRNVELFAKKHHIPVLSSFIVQCNMKLHDVPVLYCFPPAEINLYGVKIRMLHIRYDSVDPVYLIVEADGKAGIVIDGKLNETSAEPLMDCDDLVLLNRGTIRESMPLRLIRRVQSVYNSEQELRSLFRNYRGNAICAPGETLSKKLDAKEA